MAWCATGAIQKLCGGPEDGFEARRALVEEVGIQLAEWNDWRAKSAEEVASAMERASKHAASHEINQR